MMYYPWSENKGADQIRGYYEADPAPLFSPMQIVSFPMRRLLFCSAFKVPHDTYECPIIIGTFRPISIKKRMGNRVYSAAHVFKSDHAAQFIGNFTEHTQRISSRFSRKL